MMDDGKLLVHKLVAVVMCLLHMITLSAEQFIVTGLEGPVLAPFGKVLELSCQLSPPQNAQHMEIRWFRTHYTQPIYLYDDGKDMFGKIIPKYVERTELLKDAIGEGKVTLRIFNVNPDDDGQYHCIFKDGKFYEEHITKVKVIAGSSWIQILVHPPTTKGVILECHSRGWFPRPHLEWRDSRGEVILASSKSHSQDGDKLFDMKITLHLRDSSLRSITCCLWNPLTGQEESTSIILPEEIFSWNFIWKMIVGVTLTMMALFIIIPSVKQHILVVGRQEVDKRQQDKENSEKRKGKDEVTSQTQKKQDVNARLGKGCSCTCSCPCFITSGIAIVSIAVLLVTINYLYKKNRVFVTEAHFDLDSMWLDDMTMILSMLMVFGIMFTFFIYFMLRA